MQATTHCPEGITSTTLAAWRDGVLSTDEAERITTHVPECSACSAELATHDSLDAVLRRMGAPEPDGRLWQAVRDGMNGGRRRQHGRADGRAQRFAGGLGAVAAVVLLALGLAQVLHYRAALSVRSSATATATSQPQGTPTPLPTAIPPAPAVDGPHPNWQQAQLPTPLDNQHFLMFAIAPNDGEVAYACNVMSDDNGGTLTFYRTTDRALHWTMLTKVQVKESSVSIKCAVTVDALDADRVLMSIYVYSMTSSNRLTWYELSEDGGTTWTRLDATWRLSSLATLNGKTYALRQKDGTPQDLAVSVDHLHTWQSVSQALIGPQQWVSNFWLSPSGELLAEVSTMPDASTSPTAATSPIPRPTIALWQSSDGGAHWSLFATPTVSGGGFMFVVGQRVAGQPWQVCLPYQPQVGVSAASLDCTFDGGRTWSARPLLCTTAPCPPSSQVSKSYINQYSNQYVQFYTLASDGAVLVAALAPGSTDQAGLYRLPRGSTIWQYLGPLAGDYTYSFAPTPQGGILWANSGGGNYEALPGAFSTATYP
ncbi:MAG TPA: hypothetical protein VF510_00205 [Ktedonobacterales bacterium]